MPDILWQHFHEIAIKDTSIRAEGLDTDFDLAVTVRDAKDDGVSFEARILNLADDTWNSFSERDPIAIRLGWVDGPQSTVCLGEIEEMWPEQAGNDTEYVITGVDESDKRTGMRITRTYEKLSPSAIARDFASELSLSPGVIDPTDPFEGTWPVTKERPLRYWLNQLVDEAQNQTGEQWGWDARAGQLHFKQKATPTQEAVVFSHDNSLLNLDPASGKSTADSADELEFKALCEPMLRKGGLVQVQTAEESGVYMVTDMEFESDTRDGSHFVTGTLAPQSSSWSHGYPRAKFEQIRREAERIDEQFG